MKRCSRCQAVYTDEVRWCPADGTPTDAVAPSPAALAAAANHIPEGAPTLHDMPAVGPGTAGWTESPRASTPNTTMIGASPLPRMPSSPPSDNPVGDTLRGAPSPVPHAPPVSYSPTGPQASTPVPSSTPAPAFSPNATMIGPQASTAFSPQAPAFSPTATMSGPQASPPASNPQAPAFSPTATMSGPQASLNPQAPAFSPTATMSGPQASTASSPQAPAFSPTATMIGPQASAPPAFVSQAPAFSPTAASTPAPQAPTGPQPANPLNATMIGAALPFAQRGPALSPELAKIASTIPSGPTTTPTPMDAGPHGPSTLQGSPEVRAPSQPTPLSAPSTVPGALIPPIQTPLMNTFMGTTSEPPRTPHGSATSPADLGPQGNTFMGAPSPVLRAPAAPPTTVPGALVPPIHSPLLSTFTGTTSEPPRTPHGSSTSAADLAVSPSQPVPPAAHTPGPVSQGWDIPELPADSPSTGTSPAALAAAATVEGRPNTSTLQGFAPSPEVLRAIQEQRAKIAAQQPGQTQPMAAPVIAAEAYIPSGSESAESYASMAVAHSTAMTAVGSATDPAIATPVPLTSTLPALSPLPMQPAVVLMASQQPAVASAISQAPLPSVSMPHPVAPAPSHEAVVVSQSMTMAAAQLSSPRPPTASLLEAPPFRAAAAAAAAKPSTAGDTDKHRAVGSNKTLWIVFAVIAVAMIGATIAILVTRS